jgi:hypothetical protein
MTFHPRDFLFSAASCSCSIQKVEPEPATVVLSNDTHGLSRHHGGMVPSATTDRSHKSAPLVDREIKDGDMT